MGKKRKAVSTEAYSGRLAARIVRLREAAELTPEEVVAKMASYKKDGFEMTASSYRHWEGALRQINWDAVPAICRALGVKPRDLIPTR